MSGRSAVLVFAALSVVLLALLVSELHDYFGTTFVVLGLLIAASGGIGGGGILVPLLILVFGFSPKHAIPLSNFTIVGSSITNMLMNIPKRHPDADRPLVDWDLILVMEPLTMAGAIVGAFTSKVLPDWILVISLVILLAYTSDQTLKKGLSQWNKETRLFESEQKSELVRALEQEEEMGESESLLETVETGEAQSPKISEDMGEDLGEGLIYDNKQTGREESAELRALLESERATPWDKVKMVSLMVAVVVVLNLLKGGGQAFPSPLGIECGSSSYWMLTAVVFAWVLSFSFYMRSLLIEKWRLKMRLGYRYMKGDVEWNPTNTIVYPCICFFAGFFAGLFGVGGGIVKGPLMLQMGVNPLVASGTVAVMIMYTSVAATTMFIAFGTLTWDYAMFLFVVGLLSTVVGQYVVFELVRQYKRVSLVSLSIGAVCLLSTMLMGLQSIFSLIDMQNNPDEISTSSLCGASK
ncbi:sulfite exporter TauE/SafE-domain-containing protein [Ochromonadaceae sp. CCMP2298]|nr:sulfite exporter TauE/SafE-domain-containing protein [Ochromonadaceae sp. CCMP2298]